jgi:hypothetical protein
VLKVLKLSKRAAQAVPGELLERGALDGAEVHAIVAANP